MPEHNMTKREPNVSGKIILLLITISIFVGGIYDVGPSPITIGAILGAGILEGVPTSLSRFKEFALALGVLWFMYALLEWMGRLLGSAFS